MNDETTIDPVMPVEPTEVETPATDVPAEMPTPEEETPAA